MKMNLKHFFLFKCRLPSNRTSAVIIRPDRHSSVIKRQSKDMFGNIEAETTSTVSGFCECGWPYNMLLPRGTKVMNSKSKFDL